MCGCAMGRISVIVVVVDVLRVYEREGGRGRLTGRLVDRQANSET